MSFGYKASPIMTEPVSGAQEALFNNSLLFTLKESVKSQHSIGNSTLLPSVNDIINFIPMP
jgi:hypothetical protein